jgi:glycosyltransferase involved in cell wall biosynthesis
LKVPAQTPIIGGVFRLYPEKRPELWVRTAAEVARLCPDAVFVLMGWGPMEARVRRCVAALGLEGRVHFMTLEADDIGRCMAAFDVCLLTSEAEGTPNVLLEAQALGVPVVATPGGGVPESLIDGTTGFIASVETPAAIARCVLTALKAREGANRIAEGLAFINNRFGIERMIDETLAVYGIKTPSPRPAVDAAV